MPLDLKPAIAATTLAGLAACAGRIPATAPATGLFGHPPPGPPGPGAELLWVGLALGLLLGLALGLILVRFWPRLVKRHRPDHGAGDHLQRLEAAQALLQSLQKDPGKVIQIKHWLSGRGPRLP